MFKVLSLGSSSYGTFVLKDLVNRNIDCDLKSIPEGMNPILSIDAWKPNLVVFTGGADVYPPTYGHEPHHTTNPWYDRDIVEKATYKYCITEKIPILGICRGSQFLWTMCGGKLFQDVDGHAGQNHLAYDLASGDQFKVNSTHHQMANINTKPERVTVLAISMPTIGTYHISYSTEKKDFVDTPNVLEVEAWKHTYRSILGIQWHPEAGASCPGSGKDMAITYIRNLTNV